MLMPPHASTQLSPLAEQTERTLEVAQTRTQHLVDLHRIDSTASPEFQEWSRIRLDRMLADYMLRQGYTQAAAELARSRGIEVSSCVLGCAYMQCAEALRLAATRRSGRLCGDYAHRELPGAASCKRKQAIMHGCSGMVLREQGYAAQDEGEESI